MEINVGYFEYMSVAFTLALVRDIRNRKHMEAERLENEARYREVFENTSDIIIIGEVTEGRRLRLLDFNPACEKTAWFDRDLMTGSYLEDVFTDETLSAFMEQYHACIEKKSPVTFEQKINTAAGQSYIETMLIPVSDTAGNIYRLVGICRDISEKRSLESRLLQAQKMEAIGYLAGGIAHDFNNMLMVIMGRAQIAMGSMNSSKAEFASLQEIIKAAERSGNLTRQLLGFARQQTIMPVVLDLNTTVESILKMLQRMIGDEIELNWQPCRDLWHVRMDPSQIDQVMANLCINARDAIAGTGKITVRTDRARICESHAEAHPDSTPGDFMLLTVEDNGHGMDKETLGRVFEPFFTTKEPGKGTGLGLATVYGIIRQNNGFIEISSEPGQGTVFRIYLPRYTAGTVSNRDLDKMKDFQTGIGGCPKRFDFWENKCSGFVNVCSLQMFSKQAAPFCFYLPLIITYCIYMIYSANPGPAPVMHQAISRAVNALSHHMQKHVVTQQ